MAVTAEARICNRALLRIMQSRPISSLDEATTWARSCKALFADSRDAVLEARDWPFARRRAVLAQIADGARGGWGYAYTLPDDCIEPRFIEPSTSADADDDDDEVPVDPTGLLSGAVPVPFETEDDETLGRVLLTDEDTVDLVYTARVTAVPRFSPLFVDALAWQLAADLALGVAKKGDLAEKCMRMYELALARAGAAASKARKPRARPPSTFERNR